MYKLRESDKHFLWSLFSAIGIVMIWKGIWEGIGSLPIIENPWVSLFIGLIMLTFSGIIFKEFDPLGGLEKGIADIMNHIQHHPKKHEFSVKYYDSLKKKEVLIAARDIHHLEKNMVAIIGEGGKEVFVPMHRIRSVHRKGKLIWKM
ncbi:DUF504 domain-containing protein [Candidatus Woesearchaeota archaeon]|nr:DUF504 domain-containing protein [Candidatus Woesearchaeota archaeon]